MITRILLVLNHVEGLSNVCSGSDGRSNHTSFLSQSRVWLAWPEPSQGCRASGAFNLSDSLLPDMSPATHTCTCGAVLRYKQDLMKENGGVYPTWKCKDCGTPVPGTVAERIRHQSPS